MQSIHQKRNKMSDIIVTTAEQLEQAVMQALVKVLPVKEEERSGSTPDTCSLMQAIAFLHENGYQLSKSKLYKLTSTQQIPFRHFGRRLIFSREELLEWVKGQTISMEDSSEALLTLAESARKKSRR